MIYKTKILDASYNIKKWKQTDHLKTKIKQTNKNTEIMYCKVKQKKGCTTIEHSLVNLLFFEEYQHLTIN